MSEIDRAFRATTYRVSLDDGAAIDLRIGEHSLPLDELLDGAGVSEWAFITAWNPGSQPLDEAENRARQSELLSLLERQSLRWLPGSGIPADDAWRAEESVLVLGISETEAVALGKRYGQLAIVVGRRGESAALVYCAPRFHTSSCR